jgi:hypothetical protein
MINRRKFLKVSGAGVVGFSGVLGSENSDTIVVLTKDGHKKIQLNEGVSRKQSDSFVEAGVLTGGSGNIDVGDPYESRMYWAPQEFLDINLWAAAATVGPSVSENDRHGRVWLNKDNWNVTDYLLLHERAHNLGYEHGEGGIVNYERPDIYTDVPLDDVTKDVVENTDEVHDVVIGDNDSLIDAVSLWRDSLIGNSDISWAVSLWSNDDDVETVYTEDIGSRVTNRDEMDNGSINTGGYYRPFNRTNEGTGAWG